MPHAHDLPTSALAEVVAALELLYDPRDAEAWDAVGLVCGDPASPVRTVLFAVDPVAEVVDEALALGADLIVAHHPLLLSAVHAVPASDPRGAVVHRLVRAGSALFTAHTNADVASPGVSDSLAGALGLVDLRPLVPAAGLQGLGRIGTLPSPMSLQDFAAFVAAALPPTAWGVRATGDPAQVIRTVAVCGGSGGSAIEDARRAGVDAYVTADLRHHVASDAVADGGPALIDAAHWATEWPWLPDAARRLRDSVANVECVVSTICTDPWTLAVPETRPRSSAHE